LQSLNGAQLARIVNPFTGSVRHSFLEYLRFVRSNGFLSECRWHNPDFVEQQFGSALDGCLISPDFFGFIFCVVAFFELGITLYYKELKK
jgi:hypothetical protein